MLEFKMGLEKYTLKYPNSSTKYQNNLAIQYFIKMFFFHILSNSGNSSLKPSSYILYALSRSTLNDYVIAMPRPSGGRK